MMDLLQGMFWLFMVCVVILFFTLWLHTNRESSTSKMLVKEISDLRKLMTEHNQIVSSNNSTVAMGNIRIQDAEKKVNEALSEVEKFQEHLARLREDHARLVNLVAWKRPVIRMEDAPKRKMKPGLRN